MDAVAITDHGVMFGVVEFYKEARKNGICKCRCTNLFFIIHPVKLLINRNVLRKFRRFETCVSNATKAPLRFYYTTNYPLYFIPNFDTKKDTATSQYLFSR